MVSAASHLSHLIPMDSVSRLSNRPVIDYAETALRANGWRTTRLEYADESGVGKHNLVGAPPGQDATVKAVDLTFVCHTDTVPHSASWTNALTPQLEAGKIHGCGACDVKGFLACLLAAVESPVASTYVPGLRILLTADEEVGCIGAARLLAADLVRPRRVVIGEPTSLHVARAGKGYCLASVTVVGREAHSAHPDRGASAIYAAARLISEIEAYGGKLTQDRHPFFDPGFTTVNVGTIRGGAAKNIIPGSCEFLVEWRPIPGQAADRVLGHIGQVAEAIKQLDPRLDVRIESLRQQPGFETSADASLVSRIVEDSGRPAASISFASEASLFRSIAEEVVVFGPGDMRTAHSDREFVPVAELESAVEILTRLMRS
jgi:acetylornithine deacetylase